jgi:hypothetical protein
MQFHLQHYDLKAAIEIAKGIAETSAYILAAGFFVFKWVSGYQTTNLSLEIKTQRQADRTPNSNTDDLEIVVILTKGDRGSAHIFNIDVLVNGKQQLKLMSGLEHYMVEKPDPRKRLIDFTTKDEKYVSFLNPGERTEVATVCKVLSEAICDIQVVVVGRRKLSRDLKQWRASAISLPDKVASPSSTSY